MPALSAFATFQAATGPAYIKGPEDVINEVCRRSYVLSKFLDRANKSQMIQGGNEIRDLIMLDATTTSQFYLPNESLSWSMPQTGTTSKSYWRYQIDHKAWTDQEEILNIGNSSEMTRTALKVRYKNFSYLLDQRMWTSFVEKMESALWANPASIGPSDMEDAAGRNPMSIYAFVNEEAAYLPDGWTTVQNINPTTQSLWRNADVTYDYDDPSDAAGQGDGFYDGVDDMILRIGFKPAPIKQLTSAEPNSTKSGNKFIACSRGGLKLAKKLARESNDFFRFGPQDAGIPNPMHEGLEFMYVQALDTASLYDAGGGLYAAEDSATKNGYRYYFLDTEYLVPIFHNQRYFYRHDPFHPDGQPSTTVQPYETWWNLWCRSRQRLGILHPAA